MENPGTEKPKVDDSASPIESTDQKSNSNSEGEMKQEPKETPSLELSSNAECKICQAEEFIHQMESPCRCSGTLKYAHRDCIQQWINSRYNTMCEICKQPYEGDFSITVPPPPLPLTLEARLAQEEAEREAERAREEARRAAGEAYAARLPQLNNAALGESALCRISSFLFGGLYVLFMVGLMTGFLDFRALPPSPPPLAPPAPDLLPPHLLMMNNNNARALRFWH